jgi:hypothetical protein
MKKHWISLAVIALLVVWMLPEPASAARRDRILRRAERNTPQQSARTAAPSYQPRDDVDRLFYATPRLRRYYRINGWPSTNTNRSPVARNQPTPPRNYVERSDAVEQLPELREPTLNPTVQPQVDRAVEPASYAEAADFDAAPPQSAEPHNAFDANEQWRQERIDDIERRLQALEAVQSASQPRPEPLAD